MSRFYLSYFSVCKQKTAYELRISDWSSDVSSSDLCVRRAMEFQPSFATSYFNYGNALRLLHVLDKAHETYNKAVELEPERGEFHHNQGLVYQEQGDHATALAKFRLANRLTPDHLGLQFSLARSEEHTSELQSLMRISYAVFCLKKKITHKQ